MVLFKNKLAKGKNWEFICIFADPKKKKFPKNYSSIDCIDLYCLLCKLQMQSVKGDNKII